MEMLGFDMLGFIAVGFAVGTIAGQSMKQSSLGIIGDIFFGVAGALLAGYLFHMLGLFAAAGLLGSLIFAAIGSIMLLVILRIVNAR